MIAHTWKPIEDLPDNWADFRSLELESLAGIWQEQRARLEQLDAVVQFHARFRREWAIETGIIENLYAIDRGTTRLLIEQGLEANLIPHNATDKPAELVINLIKDQESALEGLMDFIGRRRALSTSYVKELHAALTQHQLTVTAVDQFHRVVETEHLRGAWKRQPNNPTRPDGMMHQYCPPEHVAAEMDRLMAMHLRHVAQAVAPEVEAAWLHHRFTQIHPFQDGNGRVARALSSLVLLRAGYFPLLVNRDERSAYIIACEEADLGNLAPLTALFIRLQKAAFLRVFSIAQDVLHDIEPLKQMISAVGDRYRARRNGQEREKRGVLEVAQGLRQRTVKVLRKTADSLRAEIQRYDENFHADIDASDATNDHLYKAQIIAIARDLDYYADTGTYRAWVRLRITELRQVELVISFHSLGFEFLGILAASAFVEYRQHDDAGATTVDGPHRICKEVFQFSYTESPEAVTVRFDAWLNDVILTGLDEWRRQL